MSALRLLDKAAGLCHANPIPRFHKAKVLESLGRNEVGIVYMYIMHAYLLDIIFMEITLEINNCLYLHMKLSM